MVEEQCVQVWRKEWERVGRPLGDVGECESESERC